MATFALSGQRELAGPMNELVERPIALLADSSELSITTEYGEQAAIRAQVVDAYTGEDLGMRLVFWSTIREEVLKNSVKGIWTVGVPTEIPQANNEGRTVYVLATTELDEDRIADALTDW